MTNAMYEFIINIDETSDGTDEKNSEDLSKIDDLGFQKLHDSS